MSTKVAVVTGSNKGIGFGIVRGLCKLFSGDVYLTSRDEARGRQAVSELQNEGLTPLFHQLDINNQSSINNLARYLKEEYGGVDLLVNNAGIAYKMTSEAPFAEQAEFTLQTNYWANLAMCKAIFPLLNPGARVVNVSSMTGVMSLNKCSPDIHQKIKSCQTLDELGKYMMQFVEDAKAGCHAERGWASSSYGMSKLGLTAMSFILQADMDKDGSRPDIVINACCPGYVDTDMSSHKGTKTIEEGADTPVYLSLLPPNTDIRGQFVSERKVVQFWK